MRPYERLTILQLQTQYYEYSKTISDARCEQEAICVELLYRVETAEAQIPAPAPE